MTDSRRMGAAVVPLLAFAVFINYVDRGNLSTAAPLVKTQLGLSSTEIGFLLSSFFWTYVPAQLLAGALIVRINPYRTLALGVALWSVATLATGLAGGFAALLALRLLLGVGEGAIFPCSSTLLAQNLPGEKLGAANGLLAVGLALGPAFGTYVGGIVMAQIGWRLVFVAFGIGSLLWLLPWVIVTRQAHQGSTGADTKRDDDGPAFGEILRRREVWGASIGHFCVNYAFYFVISWLPTYLVSARGLSVREMARVGGIVYLIYAATSMATGLVSDYAMRRGATANLVRKTSLAINGVLVFVSMWGIAYGDVNVSLASLYLAGFAFGFSTQAIYAVGQTLAGPRAAARWMGIQNCLGNIAGIAAPLATGFIVDHTGQFFWAFIAAGAVALTGVVGWLWVIPRVETLAWAPRPTWNP
jgi:MFS family permease